MPFLNYKPLKPQLRKFLAGHTVAMVTYYVMERTTICSPIIGQCFDTMIAASSDKEWLQWPIEILVLETVLSHLKLIKHCFKCLIYLLTRKRKGVNEKVKLPKSIVIKAGLYKSPSQLWFPWFWLDEFLMSLRSMFLFVRYSFLQKGSQTRCSLVHI